MKIKILFLLFVVLAGGALIALRGHVGRNAPEVGQVGGVSAGKVGALARPPLIVSPSAPAPTLTPWTCVIRSGVQMGTVNLRECGSTTCPALAVLTEGDTLTVTTSGEWLQVQTAEGLTGFVYADFCKGW